MKKLKVIIEIAVIVILLPLAFTGLTSARTIEYEQTAPSVVTAAATTADVTLIKPLFDDDVVYVTEISSSNATDVPAVSTYTTGTKALTVAGLVDNATRTLTVTYDYARFTGNLSVVDTLVGYLPLFLIFGLALDVILQTFSGRGKRL